MGGVTYMLDHLGNIGDFLGGIGVVVTLLYLALQIRQNTKTMRATGAATSGEIHSKLALILAQDSDARRVYFGGLEDYESLSEDERAQFEMLVVFVLGNLDTSINLHSHGAVDDESLESSLALLNFVVSKSGFHQYWAKWGRMAPTSLKIRVDSMLAEEADLPAAQQSAAADSA